MAIGVILHLVFMEISHACYEASFKTLSGCDRDHDTLHAPLETIQVIHDLDCPKMCSSKKWCRAVSICSSSSSITCNLFSTVSNGTCDSLSPSVGCRYLETESTCNPVWKTGPLCDLYYKDCTDAFEGGLTGLEMIEILPDISNVPFEVRCMLNFGGWTELEIQNSQCSDTIAHRSPDEYEGGFGHLDCSFFIGLHKMHQILQNGVNRVDVYVTGADGINGHAYYDNFRLGNKQSGYMLDWDSFFTLNTSPVEDGLGYGDEAHNLKGAKFAADPADDPTGCAASENTGWWYKDACAHVNFHLPFNINPRSTFGAPVWPKNGDLKTLYFMTLQVKRMG